MFEIAFQQLKGDKPNGFRDNHKPFCFNDESIQLYFREFENSLLAIFNISSIALQNDNSKSSAKMKPYCAFARKIQFSGILKQLVLSIEPITRTRQNFRLLC